MEIDDQNIASTSSDKSDSNVPKTTNRPKTEIDELRVIRRIQRIRADLKLRSSGQNSSIGGYNVL